MFSMPFDPLARAPSPNGILLAGRHGRRRLGALEAETILRRDALAVQPLSDGRFLFVMADGQVAITSSALGPVIATLPGPRPAEAILDATAGVQNLFVIDSHNTTFRSSDHGQTWSAVAALSGPLGPNSIALDHEGHGLLLMTPQRLFVTTDDGSTWSRLESDGGRPKRVYVDRDGRVGTEGWGHPGVLALSPLRLEEAKPEAKRPSPPKLLDGPLFVGTHVARVIEPVDGAPLLRIGPLGAATIDRALPPGEYWPRSLAGDDRVLWVGTTEKGRVILHRSEDRGASWLRVSAFEFRNADPRRALVVTPEGGVVAIGLTDDFKDQEPLVLVIRPNGQAHAHHVPKPLEMPRAVAFERGTMWLLDERGNVAKGGVAVRKARPSDPIFTDLATTDDRVWLTHDHGGLRLDLDGHEEQQLLLPEPVIFRLAGGRGVLVGATAAWETADGGAHFGSIAVSSYGQDFVCRPEGCAFADGERIGWDEPTSTPLPSIEKAPPATPAPELTETSCTATGKWLDLVSLPTWLSGSRWVGFHESKSGMVSAVIGSPDGALVSHALLQKTPKDALYFDGPLAGRLSIEKSELAWWSESSHAVKRHVVTSEHVSEPRVVDGGVVWQSGDHLTWLPEGGSSLPLPISRPWDVRTWLVKAGDDVVVRDGSTFMFWDGKVETRREWEIAGHVELVNVAHRPFAAVQLDSDHPWLLPLDHPTVDPPDPILLPANAPVCADDDGRLFRVKGSDRAFSVAYDVLPHVYRNVDRLLLVHRDGSACLRGWMHDTLLVFTSKTATTGWVMERLGNPYSDELRRVRMRPLTCP